MLPTGSYSYVQILEQLAISGAYVRCSVIAAGRPEPTSLATRIRGQGRLEYTIGARSGPEPASGVLRVTICA